MIRIVKDMITTGNTKIISMPDEVFENYTTTASAPVVYNSETNTLSLAAGNYTDYKGNVMELSEPMTISCDTGLGTTGSACAVWLSFGSKWASGYGLMPDNIYSENYDGGTYYIMNSPATYAFLVGEADGMNMDVSPYTFINFQVTFNSAKYSES